MMLTGHAFSSQFMEWRNLGITTLKNAIYLPNFFFSNIAGKPNKEQFYLPNFLKLCDNILHILLRTTQFPEKIYENSGMVQFSEINQVPSPYSMLMLKE